MRPMRTLLFSLLVLVLSACAQGPQAPAPETDPLATGAHPGVSFLPPIGAGGHLSGDFDPDVDVHIDVFDRSTDDLVASFSVVAGDIEIASDAGIEAHYRVDWDTQAAGLPLGSIVRIEVRLPHAEPGKMTCGEGVDLVRGCLAFVDVQFLQDRVRSTRGAGAVDIELVHGQVLPIHVHVQVGVVAARLLVGEPDELAVDAVHRVFPLPVPEAEVLESRLITTRLDAFLHPEATVADVNAALALVGARIDSTLGDGDISITLIVPALTSVDAARDLSDLLMGTGAFAYAMPAFVAVPRLPVESTTEGEVSTMRLPDSAREAERDDIRHLEAMKAPAAWNISSMLVRNRLTVLVPDYYYAGEPSTGISTQEFIHTWEFDMSLNQTDPGTYIGNHGFHVSGIIGADFDDHGATGVYPVEGAGHLRVLSFPISQISWAERLRRISDVIPPLGNFVINTSLGYNDATFSKEGKTDRAFLALKWRAYTSEHSRRFIQTTSAGNDPGFDARYTSPWTTSASFEGLGDAIDTIHTYNWFLVYTYYKTWYQQAALDTRSTNTLIVGSSNIDGVESDFSSSLSLVPDAIAVRAVGERVFAPCHIPDPGHPAEDRYCDGHHARYSGTSMAAPQVAGLAAYMWNLDASLSVTRIVEIVRSSYRNGLVDAYEAVLAAGGVDARRALLDVNNDGRFDEHDIALLLEEFAKRDAAVLDHSRFDLNGDGRTGGASTARFDLTMNGRHEAVDFFVEAQNQPVRVALNEVALTDMAILCFYAFAAEYGVYQGDALVRNELIGPACAGAEEAPSDLSDLTIEDLTVSPANATAGSGATVSFTLRNIGEGEALPSTTNIRINSNPDRVTTRDHLLASLPTPRIAAGRTRQVQQTVSIPDGLGGGTYYVWVIADVHSTANQSDEGNDTANVALHVADSGRSPMRITVDVTPDHTGARTVTVALRGSVDVTVDWGDGNAISTTVADDLSHTYAADGPYTISVSGSLTHFGGVRGASRASGMTGVLAWGDIGLLSLSGALSSAVGLTTIPGYLPPTVTDASRMFMDSEVSGLDITGWDVSNVTDMSLMFRGSEGFEAVDLSGWNVSRVTDMSEMFFAKYSWPSGIADWDVSSVTSMRRMFSDSALRGEDIGGWVVSSVTDMEGMFAWTWNFNEDIGGWDVSNVTNMNHMFAAADRFDQDLSRWCVTKISEEPDGFADEHWDWPRPIWGTCPSG